MIATTLSFRRREALDEDLDRTPEGEAGEKSCENSGEENRGAGRCEPGAVE